MNPLSRHSARPRIAVALLVAAFCGVVLAGCIIIPVDYHAKGSRHNVTSSSTNALQLGATTREEMLLTLGEPDFVSEDGRRFGYLWTKVKAIWAIASYGGSGAGGEITMTYLVETSFDASNRVSAVQVREQWGDTVTGTPGDEGVR